MSNNRYVALGPLLAGEGSRAFLGLEIQPSGEAQPVVLVWLPEAAEKDPKLMEQIRRETEHASKLDHPHIVRVHGFASLDEGHARVVEFADGESLRKLLELAKKIPPAMAAKIVCDVAMGVNYAHVAGNDDGTPLVHGDIRPETILISFNGVTKVSGYGALAFAPREMGGQRVKGRRVHTAPEQIIAGREGFNLPTDVYLLGLTLLELITGEVPFSDQNDFFDHAVLTLPLPPPRPGEVPPELEAIIFKACAKKLPDRYPTPLAFKEAIEAAMGNKLPKDEELAAYMKQFFPESDKARAGRRLAIDAGIADYARRVWAEQNARRASTPGPTPAVRPPDPVPSSMVGRSPSMTAVPRATLPPAKPAPKAAPPAPPVAKAPPAKPVPSREMTSTSSSDLQPAYQPKSKTPIWLGLAAVVAVGAIYLGIQKANQPLPSTRVATETKDAGPAVVKAPEVDAGAVEVVAVVDSGAPAPVDAGAAAVVVAPEPVKDAGVAVAADTASFELDVNPDMDLLIDNKPIGRTPFKGWLPVGRKLIVMVNKELGIKTSRTFTIVAGEKNEEHVTIAKGSFTLSAPEGAQVYVDDRRIGAAPIRGEVPVYEGFHRIRVNVGKAEWKDTFTVTSGSRQNFNVEMQ